MAKYLIDANLPYYFQLWNNSDFLHVNDIGDSLSDEQIWSCAKQNNLIIVTKDADFSLKVLYRGTPPKVVHIKFGNLKMKDFHRAISLVWDVIDHAIDDNNMINVYSDRIEYIK